MLTKCKVAFAIMLVFAFSLITMAAYFNDTFQSNTKPQIYRTNVQNSDGSRGVYYNTTRPNTGYQTFVTGISKPTTASLTTGTLVLYGDLSSGSVDLMWIAKDVSGNITSGNVTGI
jgi:hypothetical protein